MQERLKIQFQALTLKNPLVMASGTFGFGREYAEIYDVEELGGIVSKGLTLSPRTGNSGIRIWETDAGMLNSIGLENPGIDRFIQNELPFMKSLNLISIINISGSTLSEYRLACEKISREKVDMIELNISCPNVKKGGIAFGLTQRSAGHIVKEVRKVIQVPLMVKLTPEAEDIASVAQACEYEGADALSLVNTFRGMAIDIEKKKPVFDNIYAGLSGPCIKPIALRMVYEVAKQVNIPVMGVGGIMNYQDVIKFMMAGASAVQIGTANFINPKMGEKILTDLEAYLIKNNIDHISELIGILK